FSPDGRQAVSGGDDATVRLWDVETGKQLRRFQGHTGNVCGVAFSPDGKRVLSGGGKPMRLWDASTGKELWRFEGHTDGIYDVAFSPDGKRALSGSGDKTMRLWQLSAEASSPASRATGPAGPKAKSGTARAAVTCSWAPGR